MNLFRANLQYLEAFCTKPTPLHILASGVQLVFFRGTYQSTAILSSPNKARVCMKLRGEAKHHWENDL